MTKYMVRPLFYRQTESAWSTPKQNHNSSKNFNLIRVQKSELYFPPYLPIGFIHQEDTAGYWTLLKHNRADARVLFFLIQSQIPQNRILNALLEN